MDVIGYVSGGIFMQRSQKFYTLKVHEEDSCQRAKVHKCMLWKFNVPLGSRTGQSALEESQTDKIIHQGVG